MCAFVCLPLCAVEEDMRQIKPFRFDSQWDNDDCTKIEHTLIVWTWNCPSFAINWTKPFGNSAALTFANHQTKFATKNEFECERNKKMKKKIIIAYIYSFISNRLITASANHLHLNPIRALCAPFENDFPREKLARPTTAYTPTTKQNHNCPSKVHWRGSFHRRFTVQLFVRLMV